MTNIAVIPCRGGSKGIPRKNLQSVHGIPLVVRSVYACIEAGIENVFVSTDDQEIASYARAAGARVIDRPAEFAQDQSSTDTVLLHAIEELLGLGFTNSDNLFLLQATSPFTRSETIRAAIEILDKNTDSGVFTAVEWHGFIWNLEKSIAIPYLHDHKNRRRRQDIQSQVLETGGLYGAKISNFSTSKVRFVDPLIPVLVDRIEAVEIDTWDDLRFCNSVLSGKRLRHSSKPRVLFTDFDGVLTDNQVLQLENGEAGARVNRSDGVAINQLKATNVPVVIITGEMSGPAFGRAKKLGVQCIYSEDKLRTIVEYCTNHSLTFSEIAFVGNDLNDLEPLATCGTTFSPKDASPMAQQFSSQSLHTKGGKGVLREVAGYFL